MRNKHLNACQIGTYFAFENWTVAEITEWLDENMKSPVLRKALWNAYNEQLARA